MPLFEDLAAGTPDKWVDAEGLKGSGLQHGDIVMTTEYPFESGDIRNNRISLTSSSDDAIPTGKPMDDNLAMIYDPLFKLQTSNNCGFQWTNRNSNSSSRYLRWCSVRSGYLFSGSSNVDMGGDSVLYSGLCEYEYRSTPVSGTVYSCTIQWTVKQQIIVRYRDETLQQTKTSAITLSNVSKNRVVDISDNAQIGIAVPATYYGATQFTFKNYTVIILNKVVNDPSYSTIAFNNTLSMIVLKRQADNSYVLVSDTDLGINGNSNSVIGPCFNDDSDFYFQYSNHTMYRYRINDLGTVTQLSAIRFSSGETFRCVLGNNVYTNLAYYDLNTGARTQLVNPSIMPTYSTSPYSMSADRTCFMDAKNTFVLNESADDNVSVWTRPTLPDIHLYKNFVPINKYPDVQTTAALTRYTPENSKLCIPFGEYAIQPFSGTITLGTNSTQNLPELIFYVNRQTLTHVSDNQIDFQRHQALLRNMLSNNTRGCIKSSSPVQVIVHSYCTRDATYIQTTYWSNYYGAKDVIANQNRDLSMITGVITYKASLNNASVLNNPGHDLIV